jgi:SAM-dependent methyltransferase
MSVPDQSEWYDARRALEADLDWIMSGSARRHFAFLPLDGVKTVLEWGCGSGLVASWLPRAVNYFGIDRSPHMIELARRRCPGYVFVCECAREFEPDGRWDLALAFSFVKHFGLDEWNRICRKVLDSGRVACFNVQVAERDHDNGREYPHAFVTEERLSRVLREAGHAEERRETLGEFEVDGIRAKDVILLTRWSGCAPPLKKGGAQGKADAAGGNLDAETP